MIYFLLGIAAGAFAGTWYFSWLQRKWDRELFALLSIEYKEDFEAQQRVLKILREKLN
jgi:hypothetical protein